MEIAATGEWQGSEGQKGSSAVLYYCYLQNVGYVAFEGVRSAENSEELEVVRGGEFLEVQGEVFWQPDELILGFLHGFCDALDDEVPPDRQVVSC